MKTEEIRKIFDEHKLYCGRMISGSKSVPAGQKAVFNANIVTKTHGKVWFGDINITKDGEILKEIAGLIGEPLYILREMDCRFEHEDDPIDLLITKAVETF